MREKKRRRRFLLAFLVKPLTANIYIYVYSERADHEEREIHEGEYPSLGGR